MCTPARLLSEELMAMTARDIMTAPVVTVAPGLSLAALADVLISDRVGGVPVVEQGELVGEVSRSDFVRVLSLEQTLAGMAEEAEFETEFAPGEAPPPVHAAVQRNLEKRTVREIMVTSPVTVAANTPATEVARILSDRHIHRVIVMDGAEICGVISALDLVRRIATGDFREA